MPPPLLVETVLDKEPMNVAIEPIDLRGKAPLADRAFGLLVRIAGLLVLVILGLIAVTMSSRGRPALSHMGLDFFFTKRWVVPDKIYGAGAFIAGTLMSATIAVVLAVPVSLGIALFTTQVAPGWMRTPIVYLTDLLAVVPSVVFGFWGVSYLAPNLVGFYRSMHTHFGGVPIIGHLFGPASSGRTFFTAGLVLAIMITPIITSLSREIIETCPPGEREAAYALGANRWEMITGAVMPHSKGGLVGAVMLGLGRAMGETIAATLTIGGALGVVSANLFSSGNSMPAIIASDWGEADTLGKSALVLLAVTLFVITILVNVAATAVVSRSQRRTRGI